MLNNAMSVTPLASGASELAPSLQSSNRPGAGTKGFTRGTHRLIAPEDTLARYRPLMPVLGITRIANVTGLDTIGVPVVMVTRPNAKSLSVAQGKGLTLAAAQASGLMESIESHHAESITRPLKLASYYQLCTGHSLVDVGRLPRYAGSHLHPAQRLLWIEGQNLLDNGARWLPYELVHTDFTVPLPPGSGAFVASSSGLASGNHKLEATCHGLCELIERDAVTLWHFLPEELQASTRLDLDTIDDPACMTIIDRYRQANITVIVWDVTSDIGLPVFRAAIMDDELNLQRPILPMGGYGCHPTREIALLRALTEAAQSRVTLVAGARDDMLYQRADEDSYIAAWEAFHKRDNAAGRRRAFASAPSHPNPTFADDLELILARLRAAGLSEAVVVDLSKPEFGVPVVRVVVPGLEILHDIPGYSPGARARAIIDQRKDRGS